MFGFIKERIYYFNYTRKHRKVVQKLATEKGYSFPFHDFDKLCLYPILGVRLTKKLHHLWSAHHYRNGDIKDKVQAVFDWESARYTKPDKPLDAYDTWKKLYPNVDMGPTLKKLGFSHEE